MKPHYTLASLDITNIYSNIPVKETKTILSKVLTNSSITPKTRNALLTWYDVITKQNYFAHKDRIKAPPDRREIFAAVATATISPKFRVDCGKEIRVVIHTNATVSW
jgi:hypothetical protein